MDGITLSTNIGGFTDVSISTVSNGLRWALGFQSKESIRYNLYNSRIR